MGGGSHAPTEYHLWSAISLLGAAMGTRVYADIIPAKPLYPNLYVLLVGASGIGKGVAINGVQRLAPSAVNVYMGSTSRAALFDRMTTFDRQRPAYDPAKIYVMFEEFGDSIPPGPVGQDFTRLATHLADNPMVSSHDTRTHGARTIVGPNVNLLAGSTRRWLRESLPGWTIDGGFLARVLVTEVFGFRPPEVVPPAPPLRDAVVQYLQWHVEHLTTVQGPVWISDNAREEIQAFRTWWVDEDRYPSGDDPIHGFYSRQYVYLHKLAMILAAGEPVTGHNRTQVRMYAQHVQQARVMLQRMRPQMLSLIDYVNTDERNEPERVMYREVGRLRIASFEDLMRCKAIRDLGLVRPQAREILHTLVAARRLEVVPSTTGGSPMWRPRRRTVPKPAWDASVNGGEDA